MTPVPSNETYYRRYLDDPLTVTTQSLSTETAQENLALHNSLNQQQATFNQQLNVSLPRILNV